MDNSVVIIGGGMGGLFTGALLAKNGYKVTVLEKNDIIGGGLQTFVRSGETFDPGIHVLGGFREGGSLYKICTYLGIMDKLDLKPTDEKCMDSLHYVNNGDRYDIPSGRQEYVRYFSTLFPEEADGIKNYVDALYRLTEELGLYYLKEDNRTIFDHSEEFYRPADDFIAQYISNPKLKDVFSYVNTLYGGVAHHTPAYIHALVKVLYINGEDRFVDGAYQLADALTGVIESNGGAVLNNAEVTRIFCEERAIKEVHTSAGGIFRAQWYISDIHPCALLKLLDPPDLPLAYKKRLEIIPNSNSCFLLFIKFKENSFEYINHSCYLVKDYGEMWNASFYDDLWPRGFMYMTPPVKNQGDCSRKMIITAPMSFDAVREWEDTTLGNRGEDYKRWKSAQSEKILDMMEKEYPGFRGKIEQMWSSTPLTIRDYYNTKEGAMYGYRKDSQSLALAHITVGTKIKNLLLTGQNLNLHGICGVPLTAVNTAEALLGRNRIIELINNKI